MQKNENGKITIGYYVACFVDILGQEVALKQWQEVSYPGDVLSTEYFQKTNPYSAEGISEEYRQKIENSWGKVYKLRAAFEGYIEGVQRENSSVDLWGKTFLESKSSEEKVKKFLLKINSIPKIKIQSFSDLQVFYAPLVSKNQEVDLSSLYYMCQACAFTMLRMMRSGIYFRGGISIGIGSDDEKVGLYGPILADVHRLESKVAQYPRVVVAKSVLEMLDLTCEQNGRPVSGRPMSVKELCRNCLVEDTDGEWIVNMFNDDIFNQVSILFESEDWYQDVLKNVKQEYDKFNQEYEKFNKEGKEGKEEKKLAERYDRLLQQLKKYEKVIREKVIREKRIREKRIREKERKRQLSKNHKKRLRKRKRN